LDLLGLKDSEQVYLVTIGTTEYFLGRRGRGRRGGEGRGVGMRGVLRRVEGRMVVGRMILRMIMRITWGKLGGMGVAKLQI